MIIKKTKKAIVLIYVLFLVTISIVFASIVLSNTDSLFNLSNQFEMDSLLYNNIVKDSKVLVDIDKGYNSNGSGYTDIIGCPQGKTVILSGTTLYTTSKALINYQGEPICKGDILDLKLYFNSNFNDINKVLYQGYTGAVIAGLSEILGDPDNTVVDLRTSNYIQSDLYDDNFNSDNYMVTSSGNTASGVYYPSGYLDDDVEGRKNLLGYVSNESGFKKVFWNTKKVIDIINANTNNDDLFSSKLGTVTNGKLIFDIDKNCSMKLVVFDKSTYNLSRELIPLSIFTGSIMAGTGYLQNNSGTLSLSPTLTGKEFSFNFQDNNYAIFLKNDLVGALLYKISGVNSSGSGVYIVPIDDSLENIIKYQGNEIIINEKGMYLSKEAEIIYEK